MPPTRLNSTALLLAALLLVGCESRGPSISGRVTYEGAPIKNGQITFTPTSGRGSVCSAKIENGAYRVVNVSPGQKKVQIIGVKKIHFRPPAEQAAASKAAKAAGEVVTPESTEDMPDNAEGNNQVIETTEGVQERNFDLKRPKEGP